MTLRTILTVAAGAASAFTALAPAAAADLSTRSVTVRYADLDLASTAGQSQLGSRLNRAAATACGNAGSELAMMRAVGTCRTNAVTEARAHIANTTAALASDQIRLAAR